MAFLVHYNFILKFKILIDVEGKNRRNAEDLFSKRIVAGNRTTYFFDVKEGRNGDYYVTITESTRMREGDDGTVYKKHRIYLHRENFGRFARGLKESMDFVKNSLEDVDFSDYEREEFRNRHLRPDSDIIIDNAPDW